MMKRISILLSILSLCHILIYAQLGSDWQKVRCISSDENIAVFTSEGEASKKMKLAKTQNAVCSMPCSIKGSSDSTIPNL